MGTHQSGSQGDALEGGGKREEKRGFRIGQPPAILGQSAAIREILDVIQRVADAIEARILLTGETGTGKDLIARHIHWQSPVKDGPFVLVNCGAIHEGLAETEFHGHERWAFTDARRLQRGFFERAIGGTLFLDEIECLSLANQAALLGTLDQRAVARVGGEVLIPYRCRIIAATNADLEKAVAEGRFRRDLYMRLNTVELKVPPLHARPEDILLLADSVLLAKAQEFNRPRRLLTAEAAAVLKRYSWPGNVRELENEMERLTVLGGSNEIAPSDLAFKIHRGAALQVASGEREDAEDEAKKILAMLELYKTLEATAQAMGITRSTLWLKMKNHRIVRKYVIDATAL